MAAIVRLKGADKHFIVLGAGFGMFVEMASGVRPPPPHVDALL
jgi:hypothetical protein